MAKTLIFLIFKNPKYGSKWLPVPWSLAYTVYVVGGRGKKCLYKSMNSYEPESGFKVCTI